MNVPLENFLIVPNWEVLMTPLRDDRDLDKLKH